MNEGRFAGVDWASEEHAVCVVDERGRILEGRRYSHNEPGIRALCARLVRLRVALVALERPDGLLIERLLDAGLAVIAVHPNQVKAMRPRFSVAGGKSDSFDSFVLAELARTDSHRFRVLEPPAACLHPFCADRCPWPLPGADEHIDTLPASIKSADLTGTAAMGGTGLEPVTSCL